MINSKKKIIGWILMIIGLIIALTPFTPGSILFIIGADMAFSDYPGWIGFKQKVKDKFLKSIQAVKRFFN